MALDNTASDLHDLLVTHNFYPTVKGQNGLDSDIDEGKIFAFDYVGSSGQNYGTMVLVLGANNDLLAFYGDNLAKGMQPEDRQEWFEEWLPQLKRFAITHGMDRFTPQDLSKLKHTMAGMAAIKEGLFESYYGTRNVSYSGEPTAARLMIKHSRRLGENDARYRHIDSLFVETAEGERWKLGFTYLAGGKAMLEHVRQGGRPYDLRGSHITEMVNELKVLTRFQRASNSRVLEGVTHQVTEMAKEYKSAIRNNLHAMGHARGYQQYFESWNPGAITEQDALVEDLRNLFVETSIDQRIEEALPILARIRSNAQMKEADLFESWANHLVEGTWAVPDTPEAIRKLQEFFAEEQPLGADAVNATSALYDVLGDDSLFDYLSQAAQENPDADARDSVAAWIMSRRDDPTWQDMLGPLMQQLDAINTDGSSGTTQQTKEAHSHTAHGPHGDLEVTDTGHGQTVRRKTWQDSHPGEPSHGVDELPWHGSTGKRYPSRQDYLDDLDEAWDWAKLGQRQELPGEAPQRALAAPPGSNVGFDWSQFNRKPAAAATAAPATTSVPEPTSAAPEPAPQSQKTPSPQTYPLPDEPAVVSTPIPDTPPTSSAAEPVSTAADSDRLDRLSKTVSPTATPSASTAPTVGPAKGSPTKTTTPPAKREPWDVNLPTTGTAKPAAPMPSLQRDAEAGRAAADRTQGEKLPVDAKRSDRSLSPVVRSAMPGADPRLPFMTPSSRSTAATKGATGTPGGAAAKTATKPKASPTSSGEPKKPFWVSDKRWQELRKNYGGKAPAAGPAKPTSANTPTASDSVSIPTAGGKTQQISRTGLTPQQQKAAAQRDVVFREGDNLATFGGPTESQHAGHDPMDRRGGVYDSFYESSQPDPLDIIRKLSGR